MSVPQGWQERVAETLQALTGTSALLESTADHGTGGALVVLHLSEREDGPETRRTLEQALDALARTSGAAELAALQIGYARVADEDFANTWKASWKPFRVGRLCIVPPWDAEPRKAGDVPLVIVPGGVFGSGRHATTRAVLRELERRVRGGERVLDAGTGTGILGVAAALLGARSVFGFDIDPNSAPAAQELARENGVSALVSFETAGFEALPGESLFDGLVANIYADVLIAEGPRLADQLVLGGWFIWSGIHRRHLDRVRRSLRKAGLELQREERRGKWCTLSGERRAPRK